MGLEEYRRKRDFKKTAEPPAKLGRDTGRSFVVQKHAARRLHYDFRLELDGVLLSWAVPKGPSLDPHVKRLAAQTEDHPVAYGSFEGIIPAGEYGAGAVIVWDRGSWTPEGDPHAGLEKGHLVFRLEGERLRGRWHLVRTRGTGAPRDRGKSWLLFKGSDAEASTEREIVDRFADSVVTGRSIEQVASDPDRSWHGKSGNGALEGPDLSRLAGAKKGELPEFVEPELASLSEDAPSGDDWLHEMKLDGYRMQARVDGGRATILSRRGHDWTDRMPSIARAVAALPVKTALFDGEVVVIDSRGISDFQALQNSLSAGADRACTYYLFDVLHLDGFDLRGVALCDRKELLAELLERAGASASRLKLSDHVQGSGPDFLQKACELGLEGVVSKRAKAPYRSGRGRDWRKSKCIRQEELVVGGFTNPSGSRSRFGALLIGAYDDEHRLVYRGKVGTGFSEQSLSEVHERIAPLERKTPPFVNPPRGADARGVHWLEPQLVAEVAFGEITQDGMLRHPRFMGLRDDKLADEVEIEGKQPSRPAKARSAPSGGSSVRLTNPDRILYPDQGITKRELAEYYIAVADLIMPHVGDRPLTLVRCPDGHHKHCFYQKHAFQGLPGSIRTVTLEEAEGPADYMAVDGIDGVLALVQFGVLEIHVSGARASDPLRPDRLVFDLDPDTALPWERVMNAAFEVRERLGELGLESWLKTTGGKGLHLVVPIRPTLEWDRAKAFCKALAEEMVRTAPNKYVATVSKAQRRGKIFIDYLRNSEGATAICAYSTRAKSGAPVSTPIGWEELSPALRSEHYTIRNLPRRIAALGRDPWEGFERCRQRISAKALRALGL